VAVNPPEDRPFGEGGGADPGPVGPDGAGGRVVALPSVRAEIWTTSEAMRPMQCHQRPP
jgi:hypothetical protein